MKEVIIGVFYITPENKMIFLPDTTTQLNTQQIVPVVNDAISIIGNDRNILNISSTDFKNILTVKRRWINYEKYDIAVICDYQIW